MSYKKIEFISSRNNSKVKLILSLHIRKNRQREKRFLLEGSRIVEDVFINQNKEAFDFVFYSDDTGENTDLRNLANKISDAGINTYETSDEIMGLLSDTKTPQCIIGIMKLDYLEGQMSSRFESAIDSNDSKVLILDKVQDPGNLGTIIRTADAAGFEGMVLIKGTADIFNSKVLRSTMGSIYNIPVMSNMDVDYIDELKENGFHIIGAALEGSVDYRACDYSGKKAIVIGNEGNGICPEILGKCDFKVRIPIYGKAESLNASIAAGILIYKTVESKL